MKNSTQYQYGVKRDKVLLHCAKQVHCKILKKYFSFQHTR